MEWGILFPLLLIIGLLIKIIKDGVKLYQSGAYSGGPGATNNGIAAMQGGLILLQTLGNEKRKPTPAECKRLKEFYEEAQAGNVSTLSLEPLRNAISPGLRIGETRQRRRRPHVKRD